jgi:hypothetical protein
LLQSKGLATTKADHRRVASTSKPKAAKRKKKGKCKVCGTEDQEKLSRHVDHKGNLRPTCIRCILSRCATMNGKGNSAATGRESILILYINSR